MTDGVTGRSARRAERATGRTTAVTDGGSTPVTGSRTTAGTRAWRGGRCR